MTKDSLIFLFFCFIPILAFSAELKEGVIYKGWKCVKLSNEDTEVYIAPDIGGRIIQYVYKGHPFLWVNEKLAGKVYPISENNCLENWKSYGGDKVWTAPQGWDRADQWPGPGDDVFDAPYKYEVLKPKGKEVRVKLISSDKGGYAGVQFIREIILRDGTSRVYFETTMKNVIKRPVSWGIWSVTQMDFSAKNKKTYNDKAYILVPFNPKSIFPAKYNVMFGLAESFNWQPDYEKNMMKIKYENIVGKIGIDTVAGWAAMVDEASGFVYVQRFPVFPGATYPDNVSFESWVAGKGYFIHKHKLFFAEDDPTQRFIEMEMLSPRVHLNPGESYTFKTSWEAHQGKLEDVPHLDKGFIPMPPLIE